MSWKPLKQPTLISGLLALFVLFGSNPGAEHSQGPAIFAEKPDPQNEFFRGSPLISIANLLENPDFYHQRLITLRGIVKQLELHLDESTIFIDYVFWLSAGEHRLLVFGQHDRTGGDIQLVTDRMVEVRGLFWKERFVEGSRLVNNLEAQQVRFFPSLNPDRT